jgi:hypothetical protein
MVYDRESLNKILTLAGEYGTVAICLPILFALFRWKYLNKVLKIFYWYCITKLIVSLLHQAFIWATGYFRDFAVEWLGKWHIENTNFMSILAYLTNFAFLGWYFYKVIPQEKIATSIRWLSIGLFVFAIIDYLFIEDFRSYGIFNPGASAIFCFILPLIHLWFLYREDSRVPLSKNPYFWIAMGLLIPNLVGCFLHFVGNGIYDADFTLYVKINVGKTCLSIIGQILLAIGFNYARYSQFLPLREE